MCTVRLYFDSGTSSILTILETEAVYWSDDAAKNKFIAERIHSKYNFPKCTGLFSNVWFFLWNLWRRVLPQERLLCLIRSDDELQILEILVGLPASVNDNHVWKKSDQFKNPCSFYPSNQYILADSALETCFIIQTFV